MNFVINILVTEGNVRLRVLSNHCQKNESGQKNSIFYSLKKKIYIYIGICFLTKLDQTPIIQVSILALAITYLVDL